MDSEPPAMVLPENVWSEVAMVERVASAIPVARANRLELTRSMQRGRRDGARGEFHEGAAEANPEIASHPLSLRGTLSPVVLEEALDLRMWKKIHAT